MHRTDGVGTINTLPSANPVGSTVGYFQNAAPGTGSSPTYFDPDWCNAIQEEIAAVVLASGQALTKGAYNQLLQAIQTLGRIKLFAPLGLYVSPAGNDANAGTALAPFLTIQKALNVLFTQYDLNGYAPTIHLADGTYTAGGQMYAHPPGFSQATPIAIVGNTASPGNVIVNITGGSCFALTQSVVTLDGMTLAASGAGAGQGYGIIANAGSVVSLGAHMVFGACAVAHGIAEVGGQINSNANPYTISGGGQSHMIATAGGLIRTFGSTVTLTGTPAFSVAFAAASECGIIECASQTFSGSATGPRYNAVLNGVINSNGGGSSYLPGGSAGTAPSGLYV